MTEMLQRISEGDLTQINTEETKEQLKVFLLAEAKTQLNVCIKLINVLDMLQDKYSEKIVEYIADNDDETAIEYLPKMITNITKQLANANEIINTVMSNEDIKNLMVINQDNRQINIGEGEDAVRTAIEDPVSREKVRETVSKIFKMIEEETQKDYVDIDDNNTNMNTNNEGDISNG